MKQENEILSPSVIESINRLTKNSIDKTKKESVKESKKESLFKSAKGSKMQSKKESKITSKSKSSKESKSESNTESKVEVKKSSSQVVKSESKSESTVININEEAKTYFNSRDDGEENPIILGVNTNIRYYNLEYVFNTFYPADSLLIAKDISKDERIFKKIKDSSFTYGEIVFNNK